MKKLILIPILALIAIALYAATDLTITVALTAPQARGLIVATDAYNAALLSENPTNKVLSQAEFAALKLQDVLNFFATKAAEQDRQVVIRKYEALSAPDKADVDAKLDK